MRTPPAKNTVRLGGVWIQATTLAFKYSMWIDEGGNQSIGVCASSSRGGTVSNERVCLGKVDHTHVGPDDGRPMG